MVFSYLFFKAYVLVFLIVSLHFLLRFLRHISSQDAGNIGGSSLDERNNIISMARL